MGGYKTWIAIAGFVCLAVYDIINGQVDQALTKIAAALALLGIGAKIEKLNKPFG